MKAGYAHDEDASTISRQIASRVQQLKRAREQRKQADNARATKLPAQSSDSSSQANVSCAVNVPPAADAAASSTACKIGESLFILGFTYLTKSDIVN